ncbi:MAG: tetratricopeptide repeat protein [Bacteroidales bacterium]|nr:tetratricopeptide repeat protein [Bacteroidales bacterium]MDD4603178.1 tetratricopeptide repeat protein [Bacteroidales bacterium]
MSKFSKRGNAVVALLLFFPFLVNLEAQEVKDAIKLTKSEQFAAASSMFKKLIQQNPNDGDIYYYFGRNLLDKYYSDTLNVSFKEKTDSAQAIYNMGIKQDPSNPINYIGLGGLSLIKKDLPQAKTYFASAMALMPSKANKAIKMLPARQAKLLIQIAESYVNANINDTAAVFLSLRTAGDLDKNNPDLYIVQGDVYFNLLNDGSKAITNYNMASVLDPKSPEAKLRIGLLWLRARQYNNALNYYQEVVKMDSTFAPAYRELGSLLSRAGRPEEAKKNFAKFLELSRNTSARKQFVNILIDLKDYSEAIAQLNEIQKVDLSDNDVNRALAYSYFEIQKYDSGLAYSRKFFKNATPEKIRSTDYVYYGRLLSKLKIDSLAPEQLLKAYSLDTAKADLISEAALSWTRVKKYDKARELYEMKINLKKGGAMDYYNLGKVYYSMQDYTKADTNLAIFNMLQPEYVQGWVWRARAKSNLDPDSKQGLAKPIYDIILEKTREDTAKYSKERVEALYFLAFYNFLQYNQTKNKEFAIKAVEYGSRINAIDPKDDKAEKAKQIMDVLKDKVK